MSLDRFVYFRGKMPTKAELQTVFEDFLGGAGSVGWDKDRFFIQLAGKKSFPFKRIMPKGARLDNALEDERERPTRWIEVVPSKNNIDILTRTQDEFTNGVADTLRNLCLRYWRGETEEGFNKRMSQP